MESVEPRERMRALIVELARREGIYQADVAAVGRMADLASAAASEWAETAARRAYHEGRADEAAGEPCPWCPPAAPPACAEPGR